MAKKEKVKLNLLDCTPIREPDLTWDEDENGIVTLHRLHDSMSDRLIQKLTKREPTYTHVTLEEFGSYIWKCMNGRRQLREIANMMKEEFGDRIEPLYPRLTEYVTTMKKHRLIFWEVPKKEKNNK